MKYILVIVVFLTTYLISYTQELPLCILRNGSNLDSLLNPSKNYINCDFSDNEYAFRKIQALMNKTGLPMNFTVCKEKNINNAYAKMEPNGIRSIVYDDVFLRNLNSSSLEIETLTILAHEIGHHLSGHTLPIYDEEFKSYNIYCDKNSISYNVVKCQEEEAKILRFYRVRELEADRFAGYIMFKYGASLEKINKVYNKLIKEENDDFSDHPSLNKRLSAVKAGYDLAEQKTKAHVDIVDLAEIKGSKITFIYKNLGLVERNRLIEKIKRAATWDPMTYVDTSSKLGLGIGSTTFNPELENKFIRYTNQKKYWLVDSSNFYFEALNQYVEYVYDKRVSYVPAIGLQIKNGILTLLLFNTPDKYRIVYSAPFNEDKVSLREIKEIFIEIWRAGIQQSMNNIK